MADLGFKFPSDAVASGAVLRALNDAVSPARWSAVKKAKQVSPVWGRTPEESGSPVWNTLLRGAKDIARRYFVHPAWRRYRFGGPLAVREINRAVSEEKP
jgi:hypothetical protein